MKYADAQVITFLWIAIGDNLFIPASFRVHTQHTHPHKQTQLPWEIETFCCELTLSKELVGAITGHFCSRSYLPSRMPWAKTRSLIHSAQLGIIARRTRRSLVLCLRREYSRLVFMTSMCIFSSIYATELMVCNTAIMQSTIEYNNTLDCTMPSRDIK